MLLKNITGSIAVPAGMKTLRFVMRGLGGSYMSICYIRPGVNTVVLYKQQVLSHAGDIQGSYISQHAKVDTGRHIWTAHAAMHSEVELTKYRLEASSDPAEKRSVEKNGDRKIAERRWVSRRWRGKHLWKREQIDKKKKNHCERDSGAEEVKKGGRWQQHRSVCPSCSTQALRRKRQLVTVQ